jgi:hypothetical protein
MRTARRRNPLVPVSVCAILMLAACGSDESVSPATDPALQPPVAVNVVGSGGGDAQATSMEAAQDADASATASDRSTGLMPAFGGYVFEAGEGLPALPTNSTGYHFPAGATVDAADVARIAAALGVEGEPQPATADSAYLWRVGPDDGTAPALFVNNDGQLSWSYSIAWATTAVAGCAVSEGGGSDPGVPTDVDATVQEPASDPAVDAAVQEPTSDDLAVDAAVQEPTSDPAVEQPIPIDECLTPEPPAGVPTADEAATRANELLAALGEDPVAFELETYADEWSASVTAFTTLDGVRWPSGYGFGFGAEGALQWASGSLAEPIATGPYPLVDLDAAIARLSEQNGMWSYGGGDVLAVDAQETEAPAAPDEVARDKTADDVLTLPAPTDDTAVSTPPEPIVATLVDVKADLWWVWDADNSVWLLPAYTFTDTEGNVFTVPAVTDEFMIVVEPTIEPQPAEPIDPVVVDPPTSDPTTTGVAAGDPAVLDEFVGVPLPEFEEIATRYGFTTRVARQDGVDQPMTMDFSETRVNVAVEGDVVTAIISIG